MEFMRGSARSHSAVAEEMAMVYRGHVKDGMVVIDAPSALPEGAEVRVEVVVAGAEGRLLDEHGQTLGDKLMKYAGRAVGLPDDAARNHDHYLYGTPKQ
jgi:hypothetical protein